MCIALYLFKFLNHFFYEDVAILRNLTFHLCQPLTELLVLLTEDSPLIQSLTNLLST